MPKKEEPEIFSGSLYLFSDSYGLQHVPQCRQGLGLVRAIRGQRDLVALTGFQRQEAQQAFGIDCVAPLGDEEVALEGIGRPDKLRGPLFHPASGDPDRQSSSFQTNHLILSM